MSIRTVPLVLFLIVWISCTEVSVDPSPYHDSEYQSTVLRYQFCDNGSGYVNRGIVDPRANLFAVAMADGGTVRSHIHATTAASLLNCCMRSDLPFSRGGISKVDSLKLRWVSYMHHLPWNL